MLKFSFERATRTCGGSRRRDFLSIGSLGLGGLGLPQLLAARAAANNNGEPAKDTSVIWLWLGGGPTHVETFDPKMTAPLEYRSVTGEVTTNLPGVSLGGTFPKMAQVMDKLALVRSFAHRNSGHGGGTHWVMTGYDNRQIDNGGLPSRPSFGSILARTRGTNHPSTGIPTYVKLSGISSDGPAFLGTAFGAFDPGGQARKNMQLTIQRTRLDDRRKLLQSLGDTRRVIDNNGLINGLNAFESQAFDLVVSESQKAFDLKHENPQTVARYGDGLGKRLLMARRLCEAGCGFVTIHYGGWDMHSNIANSMKGRSPQMDQAVAALVTDLHERSLQDNILLVISGEFGRTPKVNGNQGRDHWAPLSTLAFSGGGLQMGTVVGESDAKISVPRTTPITPQDLMATLFSVLGIDANSQFVNQAGRPVAMLDDGQPIAELL